MTVPRLASAGHDHVWNVSLALVRSAPRSCHQQRQLEAGAGGVTVKPRQWTGSASQLGFVAVRLRSSSQFSWWGERSETGCSPRPRGAPSILDCGSVHDGRKSCGSGARLYERERLTSAWRHSVGTEVRPASSASIFHTRGELFLQCQYLEIAFPLLTQALGNPEYSHHCGSACLCLVGDLPQQAWHPLLCRKS